MLIRLRMSFLSGRAAYKKNEGAVVFLGAFNLTKDCETACFEMGKGVCRSFAYHQVQINDLLLSLGLQKESFVLIASRTQSHIHQ